MKRGLIIVLLAFALFISGCGTHSDPGLTSKERVCVDLCVESGLDLNDGPCLSDNNPDWIYDDWVCDVAHEPRIDIDDLPENQCEEFRNGLANHFIEVDPGCNLIISM
ncbi:MAG: hypothetical protein ABIH25_03010 [Candidatus Woesearchaeota archaeon]